MNKLKRSLIITVAGLLLSGLAGCNEKAKNDVAAKAKINKKTVYNDNMPNLNKLTIVLPDNWTKRGNKNEIFFDDNKKQIVGGISLVGYYSDYNSSLPNHSEILNTEEIITSLGTGKLFTLKRSNPAASNNNESWNEIHAIIPTNDNLAYDIWIKGNKDTLKKILNSINYNKSPLD